VAHAIHCPSCGAKVKAGRERCPRCRAALAVPAVDPRAAAARSRRLQWIGLGMLGATVVAVTVIWLVFVPGGEAPQTIRRGDPLAARRAAAAAAPKVVEAIPAPAARPFMDAQGQGYEAYQAGDLESAATHYQDALKKNPNDPEAMSNLGQVLVRLGKPKEAIPYFERAVALNPDRWAYVFNLARAQSLLEQWDRSIGSYRRAQQLFPNDYATTFNLALTLHKSGDDASAIPEYQKAIELNPTDASFRMALAISLERVNRAEAAAAYREYLRLSPAAADADKVRARIAELTGAALPAPASAPVPAPAAPRGGLQ
jgi:tetratricopeptide (TPR) repeat protein